MKKKLELIQKQLNETSHPSENIVLEGLLNNSRPETKMKKCEFGCTRQIFQFLVDSFFTDHRN